MTFIAFDITFRGDTLLFLIDMNRSGLDPSVRQLFLEFSSSASRATLRRIFRSATPSINFGNEVCLSLRLHSSDKSLESNIIMPKHSVLSARTSNHSYS